MKFPSKNCADWKVTRVNCPRQIVPGELSGRNCPEGLSKKNCPEGVIREPLKLSVVILPRLMHFSLKHKKIRFFPIKSHTDFVRFWVHFGVFKGLFKES